jgi:hypothetical protein
MKKDDFLVILVIFLAYLSANDLIKMWVGQHGC